MRVIVTIGFRILDEKVAADRRFRRKGFGASFAERQRQNPL
jgi:hypothetical protein